MQRLLHHSLHCLGGDAATKPEPAGTTTEPDSNDKPPQHEAK
jgi:hypothetical protein